MKSGIFSRQNFKSSIIYLVLLELSISKCLNISGTSAFLGVFLEMSRTYYRVTFILDYAH